MFFPPCLFPLRSGQGGQPHGACHDDVEQSKSVADARALEGLCFFRLALFRFAADKVASPMVHDVKQSKSIAYARAVEGPALFVE